MEIYTINNKKYYQLPDIKNKYTELFKGCATRDQFLETHDIPNDVFMYAKYTNKWTLSNGKSRRYDKMFFEKKYIDDHLINDLSENDNTKNNNAKNNNIENNNAKNNNAENDIPDIIKLKKCENLIDSNGNIIEITARGKRKYNECYFSTSDISIEFSLPRIWNTLLDKTSTYNIDEHYVHFYANNKKLLYITMSGFHKLLQSRLISSANKCSITNWLKIFGEDNPIYTICPKKPKVITVDYTYCVTSDIFNAVKIGYWKGTVNKLISRYGVVYGKKLDIHYVLTTDAHQLETECHTCFENYKISNELYKKIGWPKYINFLNKNKITPE
jgi:hypothetical protein